MKSLMRWAVLLVALLLSAVFAQPALADGPQSGRVLFGQDFHLRANERLDGDLVSFGGDVTLDRSSQVRGSVVVFGGAVEVAGTVGGNVIAFGQAVHLSSSAVVMGDVMASDGVQQDMGAVVQGQAVNLARGPQIVPLAGVRYWDDRPFWWPGAGWFGQIFVGLVQGIVGFLAMAALGVLVVLLIPGLTRTVGDAVVSYPAHSIGVGLLTGLAAVLVVPILIITCLGIPVAILAVLALAVAGLFGWIAAALTLGERVLTALRQAERQPLVAVVVGILILAFLANVPCLGALVIFLVGAWGLGAVVLTRFGSQPYVPAAPNVAPPAAPPSAQGPDGNT